MLKAAISDGLVSASLQVAPPPASGFTTEQFIWLTPQVAAAMKAGLAIELVSGEIEIATGTDRQGIGPVDRGSLPSIDQ